MPSINGGMKLVKYLLFLVNLVFVGAGILLIYIGFKTKYGFVDIFSGLLGGKDGGHSIPPNIYIAVGFIMFLIAFLGCCGAITENHCMMMLYSVLIGLILVIQIGGAIAAYAFQDDVEKVVAAGLEEQMKIYYNETAPLHNETVREWNILQNTVECCGVHNYADWATTDGSPDSEFIPTSCCIDGAHDHCTQTITKANLNDTAAAQKIIYTEGCALKAVQKFSIQYMGTVGIIVAVFQLAGVVLACMMARSIRFSYETV